MNLDFTAQAYPGTREAVAYAQTVQGIEGGA